MKSLVVNWKTTASGVLSILLGVAALLGVHVGDATITPDAAIAMIVAGVGLIFAKDGNVTGGTKVLALFLALGAMMLLLDAADARAADATPAKAPAASGIDAFFKGYPYGSSGFFFGLFTEGGSAGVTGNVPGVGSASLTSTSAGLGGTIGYAWGSAVTPVALSVEADFGWTNFNGSNAGFSLSGPASFEQRFVVFAPIANLLSLLPNFPSLGTVPPFQALPAGVTASNLQMGLMAGLDEVDISPNFAGLAANKEWRVAPMIGIVAMEQLSNGSALRAWVKTVFPADKSVCFGPIPGACANLGQQVKAGVGVYW